MEDFDISFDEQQEHMREHAHEMQESWVFASALISALLAVFAAVSSLYASHYANEAMIQQIQASNDWGYYQSKGIKAMITEQALDNATDGRRAELTKKLDSYHQQQQDIKEKADEATKEAERDLAQHEKLAKAVTAFQIAIGITAIAVLARRKSFLVLTAILVLAGIYFSLSVFAP